MSLKSQSKSADDYATKETPAADEDNYYKSGAFIVDCFADQNSTLRNVPNKHRIFLKNYRKIMTREHIKPMIDIANGTIKMLQDYISFLENELNVLEETE